mgnify:CR=1 FL=1
MGDINTPDDETGPARDESAVSRRVQEKITEMHDED